MQIINWGRCEKTEVSGGTEADDEKLTTLWRNAGGKNYAHNILCEDINIFSKSTFSWVNNLTVNEKKSPHLP